MRRYGGGINQTKGDIMLVETFECQETAAEPIEACEEAIALMNELGMDGQKSLVTKNEKTGRDQRAPYREMTKDEAFVYGVLCPKQYHIKEYSRTPIPLRVLQIAAHANSLGIYKRLEVWDVEDAVEKDPVLVGVSEHPVHKWQDQNFILARWGEVLEPFVVLLRRAVEKKREQFRSVVCNLQKIAAAELTVIESMTDEEMIELGATSRYELTKPRR